MLGLAATVTAGSVYVTVQAAAQQGSDAILVPLESNEPSEIAEQVAADVLRDRGHYLAIDDNGAFTGRLLSLNPSGTEAAGGLTVKLIKDGNVVAQTVTGNDGTFNVQGLSEGTIALLAYNSDHFLLYAVNLRRVDQFDGAPAIQDIGMSSAVTSGADAQLARELVYGSSQSSEWRFQGAAGENDHGYPEGEQGTPSTATAHHDVQLQADGTLVGQVNLLDPRTGRHSDVRDLTIHFIHNGSAVGATEVAANGEFRMAGLQPGIHSVVTTGRDGVLALGINIVGTSVAQTSDSKYKLASVAQTLDLAVAPVTYRNFNPNFVEDGSNPATDGPIASLPPMAAPMGPGGFGPGGMGSGGIGSGGGAGGGVGGGGGLGALLGAAAGAGIGYALADDDDDPSSPAR
jgi:hypothetical protein